MSNDHDLVTPVNEPLGQLVDVAFDSSWLREEEVADHCDIVRWLRHLDGCCPPDDGYSLDGGLRRHRIGIGRPHSVHNKATLRDMSIGYCVIRMQVQGGVVSREMG